MKTSGIIKRLGRDSLIYGVGGILARGVSLSMVLVATRLMTPEEFGKVEYLMAVASMFGVFMNMGMDSAQSFFYYAPEYATIEGRRALVSTIFVQRFILGIGIIILTGIGWMLVASSVGLEMRVSDTVVLLIGILLMQAQGQAADIFRLEHRAISFVGLNLLFALMSSGAVIFALRNFSHPVASYCTGYALGCGLSMAVSLWFARNFFRLHLASRELWLQVILFGVPLVPGAVALALMSACDRWFIHRYLAPEMLGIYGAGAKIALGVSMAVETFRKAWWPLAMEGAHSRDGTAIFRVVSVAYLSAGVLGCVILSLFAPFMARVLFPSEYQECNRVIGILAWQSVLYGFYMIGCIGMLKMKKTWLASISSVIAASINVVFCAIFIPTWGIIGAAWATVAANVIWIAVTIIISERLWPVQFPHGVLCAIFVCGIIATQMISGAGMDIGRNEWFVAVIAIFATCVLAYFAFRREQRNSAKIPEQAIL